MDSKLPIFVLAAFNFCLYGCRAILGGVIFNQLIDFEHKEQSRIEYDFILVGLISCTLGAAATCFAFVHLLEWNTASRMTAMGKGLLALFVDMLVLGLACKMWELGPVAGNDFEGRLHFMGVAVATEVFTMMLYVAALYLFPMDKVEQQHEDEGGLTDEHHDEEEKVVKEDTA